MQRLVYISHGNIPSKWAHTFQTMKMADALGRQVERVMLVTWEHQLRRWLPKRDYLDWYGIEGDFELVTLHSWSPRAPLFGSGRQLRYSRKLARAATDYAVRVGADLVYTRFHSAMKECLEAGLPVAYETHVDKSGATFDTLVEMARHDGLRCVVTITDVLADRYSSWGVPREKLLVLPDAVDLRWFAALSSAEEGQSALRTRLRLPQGGKLAVYCGHLYDEKGVPTLLEAAAAAPEIQFALVGGWKQDVRRFRGEAAGLKNVHFTGFVANRDVPQYLTAADALVLPNSARFPAAEVTSPLKLFEYMAARRPIVASKLPIFESQLAGEQNCLLFEPDNPNDLATQLRRLMSDPALADRLADAAFDDVQLHTWDRRAQAILRFVDRLATE